MNYYNDLVIALREMLARSNMPSDLLYLWIDLNKCIAQDLDGKDLRLSDLRERLRTEVSEEEVLESFKKIVLVDKNSFMSTVYEIFIDRIDVESAIQYKDEIKAGSFATDVAFYYVRPTIYYVDKGESFTIKKEIEVYTSGLKYAPGTCDIPCRKHPILRHENEDARNLGQDLTDHTMVRYYRHYSVYKDHAFDVDPPHRGDGPMR